MRRRAIDAKAAQAIRTVRHFTRCARRRSFGNLVVTPPLHSAGDALPIDLHEWSLYRGELRVRLTAHAQVKHVLFTLGDRAIRFRVVPETEQSFVVPLGDAEFGLAITLADGRTLRVDHPAHAALRGDPTSALFERLLTEMRNLPAARALELGSRARSGTTYRQFLPEQVDYVGLDIVAGPNVDIVGDAHDLPASLESGTFGLVFSIAVFEHLAMPWKAALSINRVLCDGGLFFAGTHQTFPVHEAPWDFWRFSDRAWHSLFNRATGFEILETAMGQPADIVPHATLDSVVGIDSQPAFLTSSVLARKIGAPRVAWDVDLSELGDEGAYPN
jgi:SAM-dependent methyltransferase